MNGLITFLKTKRSKEELQTALDVLQEFKNCETIIEWMQPFDLWARLEQFEDYLKLLLGQEIDDTTATEYYKSLQK